MIEKAKDKSPPGGSLSPVGCCANAADFIDTAAAAAASVVQ